MLRGECRQRLQPPLQIAGFQTITAKADVYRGDVTVFKESGEKVKACLCL